MADCAQRLGPESGISCGSLYPLWVATWHWCDLTFIESSVVKLDYGKVSASDISRFDIALWYKKLHEMI